MGKLYPDSEVELRPGIARYYDRIMSIASLGIYDRFIHQAIEAINIKSNDKILDLGAGTGKNALIMERYLGENGEIIGLEISDQMLSQFQTKAQSVSNIS